jgi:hypothetical protein
MFLGQTRTAAEQLNIAARMKVTAMYAFRKLRGSFEINSVGLPPQAD